MEFAIKIKGFIFSQNFPTFAFTQHKNTMKISVENLGTIKKGEISLDKDLTIFTGENNSGKSYMSYLCYGFLEIGKSEDTIFSYLKKMIYYPTKPKNSIFLKYNLPTKNEKTDLSTTDTFFQIYFSNTMNLQKSAAKADNVWENMFDKVISLLQLHSSDFIAGGNNFTLKIDKEIIEIVCNDDLNIHTKPNVVFHYLSKYIYRQLFTNSLLFIPAERTAINMFYLDIVRQDAINNPNGKIKKHLAPKPITDYLYFCYDFRNYVLNPPTEFADLATELENLLGGGVGVSGFGDLQFQPTKQENQIPLYLSSSLVKSWSGVVIYLRHLAQKGDILMIDEPEINLHPKSQVLIARFLAKMVNRGIKIVVSTHSDYIIKEINNLIMLKNDNPKAKKLAKKLKHSEDELLDYHKVSVYMFENHTITPAEITQTGFDVRAIDEQIIKQGNESRLIYETLYENED